MGCPYFWTGTLDYGSRVENSFRGLTLLYDDSGQPGFSKKEYTVM